jgi:hypothetical protein
MTKKGPKIDFGPFCYFLWLALGFTLVKLQAVLEARAEVVEAIGFDCTLGVCRVMFMMLVALGFVERGTTIRRL